MRPNNIIVHRHSNKEQIKIRHSLLVPGDVRILSGVADVRIPLKALQTFIGTTKDAPWTTGFIGLGKDGFKLQYNGIRKLEFYYKGKAVLVASRATWRYISHKILKE